MRIGTAIELGRLSNAPTIATNVVTAAALAGVDVGRCAVAVAWIAMSLMYVAGGFLNDAFDRDFDRIDRSDRPIPSGAVKAGAVFDAGFAMLGLGILCVAVLALAVGAGGKPILMVIALAALIIFYDANHRDNPLAPLVMGLCRGAVYATTAWLVRPDLCHDVLVGITVVVAFGAGISYVARGQLSTLWFLGLLALPLVVAWPHGPVALAICAVYVAWVLHALLQRSVFPKATNLVAGVCLLDALLLANRGHLGLVLVALAGFGLMTLPQRSRAC